MSTTIPSLTTTRTFIGGCASIVVGQAATTALLIRTLNRIAGNVVPPTAAEAYAAGYAVGAVQGDRRQDDRRRAFRGRGAERARQRRDENGEE